MAFNYTTAVATALRLIKNFGFEGEIRNFNGAADFVAGTVAATYAKTTANMAALPSHSALNSFDDAFKANLVTGKARVFLVAASGLSFNPEPGHCILFDGTLWEIGSGPGSGGVMPLNPAGTNIIFTCGCLASSRDPDAGTEA